VLLERDCANNHPLARSGWMRCCSGCASHGSVLVGRHENLCSESTGFYYVWHFRFRRVRHPGWPSRLLPEMPQPGSNP
jgi:hypothetical protein